MPRFGFGTDPKRIPSAENLPADRPEKTKSKLFPVTLFIVPIRPDLEQSFLKAPARVSLYAMTVPRVSGSKIAGLAETAAPESKIKFVGFVVSKRSL